MSLSKKTEQDILTFLKENIIKIMRYEKLILVLDIPSISTPFIYSIRIAELTDDPEDLLEKISSIARKPEGLKLNIDITNRYYTYLEWIETFDQGEKIEYYYSEKKIKQENTLSRDRISKRARYAYKNICEDVIWRRQFQGILQL